MATQPNFKVSDSKKRSSDWYINAIDWLINKAQASNNKSATIDAINVANGIIPTSEFKQTLQPFANAPEEIKNLPGKIRNIDFITPIREKNIGEYIGLPYKYFVTVQNPDVVMRRDAYVRELLNKELQEAFINYIKKVQEKGNANVDIEAIKEKVNKLKQQLLDDEVINAQHVLDAINEFNGFEYQRINAFSDWWMTEEFYTYRYIRNGELYKELLDVAACYPISNNKDFVEDWDGFVYKKRITLQEFEQHYADRLTTSEQNYLKGIEYNASLGEYRVPVNLIYERGNLDNISFPLDVDNKVYLSTESFDLWHIFFVAQSNVKELTYTDPIGKIQKMHVGNDYELNKAFGDIEINTIWIPKVYEAFRFGGSHTGVYVAPSPLAIQRYDERSNTVKLPIGGKKGLLRGIRINPIPLRLKDYSILDRILVLAIERAVAKHKADLLTLPQSIINPDKAGTTIEKYQHMLADDTLIWDDSQIDLQTVVQGLRSIQRNEVANYIKTLWDLRIANKQDAWEIANMNSERLGLTPDGQTATSAQTNLAYAKLGSVLMITVFNKALELDHLADLEYSKYAYINGKKFKYFDRVKEEDVEIDIDPIEHFYNKYGVSVSNSRVNENLLQEYKILARSMAQNGDFELASIAIDSTSPKEIQKKITKFIEAKQEYDAYIKEKELELLKEKNAIIANDQQLKILLQDKEDTKDVTVAAIQANAKSKSSTL